MTGTSAATPGRYTLAELAALLGVDPPEAATILDERGYPVPDGDERLPLTAEEYQELVLPAPPAADHGRG
jgi:hypothetical protein